ncbi:MAG: hypothetical protein CVU84_00365 [Firmicutes bacterium HGW-Firmicutes-1]|jgi:glycosyltransferase involved in cell wall biosynthesis|nr:MAG: hypothetical protein CVU84_00365 [Firmicutes bacterium HGW-Firmicutes-1]
MNELSIIIRTNEEELKNYIEVLEQLLLNENPELIIISNEIDSLDIPYRHCIYKYSENDCNFKDFCFASSLGQKIMIIEEGLQLNEELIQEIIELLEKEDLYNMTLNIKSYLCKDESLFFIREEVIIYNRCIRGFNKNMGITMEDFSLINNHFNIETNLIKLLQGNYYNEISLWYEAYILTLPPSLQLEFCILLEKNMLMIETVNQVKLNNQFLHLNIKNHYLTYLKFGKIFREDKNICHKTLLKHITKIGLSEKEVYYCWLLKDFVMEKVIPDFMIYLNINIQKALMNHLLDNDLNAAEYIYQFIISYYEKMNDFTSQEVFVEYLYILKTYLDYMSDKSDEPLKKEKILKVLNIYIDCYNNFYCNCDTEKYLEYYTSDSLFINKMNEVNELLNNQQIEMAIDLLKSISTYYPERMNVIYFYIQKLRCENSRYPYTLSICMITKNEEKNLDRCLSSLKPLMDSGLAEIVIVDTGSDDNTLEIARKYTNNIYLFSWNNNFSEARNRSTLFAEGEYLFVVDADEEFEKAEIDKLIAEFSQENHKKHNTFTLRVKSFTNVECTQYGVITQQRIFRNSGQFHYASSIHNQPICNSPTKNMDIVILHYGYIMTEEVREKKFNRTASMLIKMLEKVPRNIYYRCQLSSSYFMYGNLAEALKQVDIYIRLIKENKLIKGVMLMYYNNAAIIYLRSLRYDDAETIIHMALSIQPDYIDFIYYKAFISFVKKEYETALLHMNKFLEMNKNFLNLEVSNNVMYTFYTVGNQDNILRMMIISHYYLGRYEECLKKVYEIEDIIVLTNCLFEIINAYFYTGRYTELAQFYNAKITGNEKMEFIFKYFLLDQLLDCSIVEVDKCLEVLVSEKVKQELIEALKVKMNNKEQQDEEDSLDLISKYYMDGMEFKSAYKIYLRIIPKLKNIKVVTLSNTFELKRMKIVLQHILHRTDSFIGASLLTNEELIHIFMKYLNISLKLINLHEIQFLEMKERLFIIKIMPVMSGKIAHKYAIQYLSEAVMSYCEMGGIVSQIANAFSYSDINKKEFSTGTKKNLESRKNEQKSLIDEINKTIPETKVDKGIKVLHGTMDLTSRSIKLSEALNAKGIYTKVFNYLPNYTNRASDFEIDITFFEKDKNKLNHTIDAALKLIPLFDVFHFHSFTSLTLDHSDLSVLKELNKKVLMHFWGQDVRLYSKASQLNPYVKMTSIQEELDIINRMKYFSKYVECCLVSDYELREYVKDYFEDVRQLNLIIDLKKYKPKDEVDHNKLFTIVHVSSTPELYGTKYVLEAINELKIFYDINFKLIQEISPENVITEADLVIDQLLIGRYGPTSVEAMALEKPVICWISDFMREKYPKELPIIIANPDNIKEKITFVLENRDMLKNLGIQGRSYAEKYHDRDKEILKLIEIYKKL